MLLIDADELRKHAVKVCFHNAPECGKFDAIVVYEIDIMPTIDPESLRPTAEWIEAPDEGADGSWEACSRCVWESRWAASQYKYCSHFGARMVNANE